MQARIPRPRIPGNPRDFEFSFSGFFGGIPGNSRKAKKGDFLKIFGPKKVKKGTFQKIFENIWKFLVTKNFFFQTIF